MNPQFLFEVFPLCVNTLPFLEKIALENDERKVSWVIEQETSNNLECISIFPTMWCVCVCIIIISGFINPDICVCVGGGSSISTTIFVLLRKQKGLFESPVSRHLEQFVFLPLWCVSIPTKDVA